jgi:hypothetical protein
MKGDQVDNEHITTPGGHLEEKRENIKGKERKVLFQTLHIHTKKHYRANSSVQVYLAVLHVQ